VGITPLPDLGSALCCDINRQDIDDVRDRLTSIQRQLEINSRDITDFRGDIDDFEKLMKEYETTIEN
jgi:hypothetical protein